MIQRFVGVLVLAVAGLLALPATPALADDVDTFVVNSTADTSDVSLGDNTCDGDAAVGIQCTLHAAMQEQNDGDTAFIDAIYFSLPASTTLQLASSLAIAPVDENLCRFCCQNERCPDFGERGLDNLTVCSRYGKHKH
ncbi:MAG: hypothetical protein ACJ75Z_02105, partial [Solirubrobacterales bacterium]